MAHDQQGSEKDSPADRKAARAKIIGTLIRRWRTSETDPRTQKRYTQEGFFRRCQKLEASANDGQTIFFKADDPVHQRRVFIAIEKGRTAPNAGRSRVLEQACDWPKGVLEDDFTTEAEFEACCAARRGNVDLKAAPTPSAKPSARRRPKLDLHGLRTLPGDHVPLPSRAKLARSLQTALRPSREQPLSIVVLQSEHGASKSQFIAEWWRDHGRRVFNQNTIALDCSRLGGDLILEALNGYFLGDRASELTDRLAERISELRQVLIILNGLSDEIAGPVVAQVPPAGGAPRSGFEVLPVSGRADRTALRRVREIVAFLASKNVRASILLGIHSTSEHSMQQIGGRLSASTRFTVLQVKRLTPEEGAQMMRALGVDDLAASDLEDLSNRLGGLPISLAAAAHYLRSADADQAEAFLIEIHSRGRDFRFFEVFFKPFLDALNRGGFDQRAHPRAYLRLLALMPGPVSKLWLDDLMQHGRIRRLEDGSTRAFERMQKDFVADLGERIDINPMMRGLLRRELARVVERGEDDDTTSREELWWIHATAARWCLTRLPSDPASYSSVQIEMIEGALYHLLALRELLTETPRQDDWKPSGSTDFEGLFDGRSDAGAITRFCLEHIARRFLIDRAHRATRVLGQFEMKARVLSLFFENLDHGGRPRWLPVRDQAVLYSEIGVCWMHAGRLKLAQVALDLAAGCLRELGVEPPALTSDDPQEADGETWRLWSEIRSTQALIYLRLGRRKEEVQTLLTGAVPLAMELSAELAPDDAAANRAPMPFRAAKRILCRVAQIELAGGDLTAASSSYDLAALIDARVDHRKLSGDALRRHIEVLVRRGPCLTPDLALATRLIDEQLEMRQVTGWRRKAPSNDIIPMLTTKIMLLRARAEFEAAESLLKQTLNHEFVLRGECPFSARMELELERYRLMIAQSQMNDDAIKALRLIAEELEARHHRLLYWDAMLLLAECAEEPEKSRILDVVERQAASANWLLRQTDVKVLREGRSAVMALGC